MMVNQLGKFFFHLIIEMNGVATASTWNINVDDQNRRILFMSELNIFAFSESI